MNHTVVCVGFSLGAAQIVSVITLPTLGLIALVNKIKAIVMAKDFLKNSSHQCISKCIDFDYAKYYCPVYPISSHQAKASYYFELFLKNLMCLIPIVGGLLASRFSLVRRC